MSKLFNNWEHTRFFMCVRAINDSERFDKFASKMFQPEFCKTKYPHLEGERWVIGDLVSLVEYI